MKRIYILLVLLSVFAGAVLTGCNDNKPTDTTAPGTNAPMPAPASTNK